MPDLHSIECSPLGSWGELKLKKWPEGCFLYFEGGVGVGFGWEVGESSTSGGLATFSCTQNPIIDYPKDHLQQQ